MHTGGGKSGANTSSVWGRRGGRLCVPGTVTAWGREGVRVCCFCSCIPRPSLVSSALLSWGHHIPPLILGPILWPLLIPCSCLTIYLLPFSGIWEPGLRERGDDRSDFFRLSRGIAGLWVPFASSLPGCIYGGRGESTE